HVEPFFRRQPADGADHQPLTRNAELRFRLVDARASRVFLRVDGVIYQYTASRRDAAAQACVAQVLRHAGRSRVARQTQSIYPVIEARAAGMLEPTVHGRDQTDGRTTTPQPATRNSPVIVALA